MGWQGFFSSAVGFQEPVCDKDTVIYSQAKDKGTDYDVEDIKFDMEQAHNPECQYPCQEDGGYGDQGKREATVEQK